MTATLGLSRNRRLLWRQSVSGHTRILWAIPLLLALAVLPARGQTGTGSIEGTVTDASRLPIPGATVTAKSPALQVPSVSAVSGPDGSYRLQTLPAGVYEVTYDLTGFQRVIRQGLRVDAGFVAKIDIELKVGQLEESLTVVGQTPVVDVKTTGSQITFSEATLQNVPVTRTMWQVLAMTPGVRMNAFDIGGQLTGTQTSYASYGVAGQGATLLDGFDTSHDQTGSSQFYLDYNSFEEAQVKAVGNGAETPNGGTTLTGIVKSGGNDFHGRAVVSGQSSGMQGKNVDDALRTAGVTQGDKLTKYYDVSGDLGGRIIRDKLWFYADVTKQEVSKLVGGFAQAPGPDKIYGTADDVQGYPTTSNANKTIKLSFQPAAHTRFTGLYAEQVKLDQDESASTFRPFESTRRYHFAPYLYKVDGQHTRGKMLVNVTGAILGSWSNYEMQPGLDQAGTPSTFDIATTRNTGPHETPMYKWKDKAESSGSLSAFSVLGGKHDLKTGYLFDWEHFGQNRYNKASGNYQLRFDTGVPFQIVTYNYPIYTKDTGQQTNWALYVQDVWTATKRLTFNYGLRFEEYHDFVAAGVKAQGTFGNSGTFPAVDILRWYGLAPRAGAALDLSGDGKTVVKGTWGRYLRNPDVSNTDPFNYNSLLSTIYRWHDLNGNRDYDPGEVALALNSVDFVSSTGASNNVVNPDLKQPASYETTALIEREVAANFSLRVMYVNKKLVGYYVAQNTPRPFSAYDVALSRQDPGPDGVLPSADDGPFITIYDYNAAFRGGGFTAMQQVNRSGASRADNYNTIEVTANKRQSHNISVVASYAATKNHRWLPAGLVDTPNASLFPLDTTWSWTGKATATYTAPYGIQLGAVYQMLSGTPGQRTYVFRSLPQSGTLTLPLDEFGTEQLPTTKVLSARIGKQLTIGRYRIDLNADIQNATNANTVLNRSFLSGPTFNQIVSSSGNNSSSGILLPRALKLGATLKF